MSDGMGAVIRDVQTLFDAGALGVFTDAQLLERFVARGDAAAFAAIVGRHGAMVWGVCRRILRDHHDAEDAFQATFLVLARRAAAIVPREKLGNWLYGVARQTALKARATRARRRGRELPMPVPAEPSTAKEPADDRLGDLDRELGRLPEKYRAPIVLCELEGRTHQQAAEQLGWPIGTLSGRLSRARTLLARRLSPRGAAPAIAALEAMVARDAASACVPPSVLSSTIQVATLGAVGRTPAAGLISPQVASLAGGVIRRMIMIKYTAIAIAAGLALGLCGIAGAMVGVGLGPDGQEPPPLTKPVPIPQPKEAAGQAVALPAGVGTDALLKARPELARKGYEASFLELRQTTRMGNVLVLVGKPDQVYRWSTRWLQAERDLSSNPAGERAALEAHLKRMTDLQKRVLELTRDILPNTQKFEAEWYVIEARLWLERGKPE